MIGSNGGLLVMIGAIAALIWYIIKGGFANAPTVNARGTATNSTANGDGGLKSPKSSDESEVVSPLSSGSMRPPAMSITSASGTTRPLMLSAGGGSLTPKASASKRAARAAAAAAAGGTLSPTASSPGAAEVSTRPRNSITAAGASTGSGPFEIRSAQIKKAKNGIEWELESVLSTTSGVASFRSHLASEFSLENIDFWSAVKQFKTEAAAAGITPESRVAKAQALYRQFIDPEHATSPVNLPSSVVGAITKVLFPERVAAASGPRASLTVNAASSGRLSLSAPVPPSSSPAARLSVLSSPTAAAGDSSNPLSPTAAALPSPKAEDLKSGGHAPLTRARGSAILLPDMKQQRAPSLNALPTVPDNGVTGTSPTAAAGGGAAAASPRSGGPSDVPSNIFDSAEQNVFALMSDDSYRRYLNSSRYQTFLATVRVGP